MVQGLGGSLLSPPTLGTKKDPFHINISKPIPHKIYTVPNIDPVEGYSKESNGKLMENEEETGIKFMG